MDDYEEVDAEQRHCTPRTGLGLERVSIASAVSTESGIHMGSDHDGANTRGPGTPELLMQSKRLSTIIKNVRRSHSYNVSDVNKTIIKKKPAAVRPKSLVYGWEESSISIEELYLWQAQLRQLHMFNKAKENAYTAKTKAMGITKVPKKDSLRAKAKTLIRGLKTKDKRKNKGSLSSSCTEEDPDSTSSSIDRSMNTSTKLKDLHNTAWNTSFGKEQWNSSDVLSILKVFAGSGLHTSHNAEYRSVLATLDTTVFEIKKQSISKYGFEDTNPDHYELVCSVGCYLDDKGNTISSTAEDFGSKSDSWKELHVDHLSENVRPLDRRAIFEEMDTTRLELRPKDKITRHVDNIGDDKIRKTMGLHHYPAEGPFLLLIQGYDRALDHVIYPLVEGETVFLSLGTLPSPRYTGNLIILHITDTVNATVRRTGTKCMLCTGSKDEQELKCGQYFNVGRHYKFIYREAIDNAIVSPEVGSPDTQRTLSTGTLTSLSPDINISNMAAGVHQHAEPRFIFYMDHKSELLDGIINYEMLLHKNPLACAHLTIMCLRHAYDNFSSDDLTDVLNSCRERIEALAKVVQQKAIVILNNTLVERSSATSFLKPMMKLLANTLEILHFIKENRPTEKEIVKEIEKLVVPMFEHVAFHTAKMVYELLPNLLGAEDGNTSPTASPTTPTTPTIAAVTGLTDSDVVDRRWSVPMSPAPGPGKRKMTKRARQASLCTVNEERRESDSLSRSVDDISNLKPTPNSLSSPRICRRSTSNKPDLTNIGQGVRNLVHLLQKFYALGSNCKLNSSMTKQLFTSIFFFSNTTLFNTIVESPHQYFNWNKGIQMRIHLDYVLKWTHQAQLSYISNSYFRELNQLLDLLSLPKKDLLSSPWTALAKTFPNLSSSQLHHVLSHYRVSQKPRIWHPPPTATLSTSIRIELTAYPSLVVPTRGYKLSSCYVIPDSLRSTLAKLTRQMSAAASLQGSRGSSSLSERADSGSTRADSGSTPSIGSCSTPASISTPTDDAVFTATRTIRCTLDPVLLEKNTKSIGLKLKKNSRGAIVVSDVVYNSPAHLSGDVECQDEVIQINRNPVTGTSVGFCKRIIQGCEGDVSLVLSRTSIS